MQSLSKTSKLLPRSQIEYRPTPGGGILVNLRTGYCFDLNRLGADIWMRFAAGQSVGQVVQELQAAYDVAPEMVLADVERVGREILAAELVDLKDEGSI